MNKVTKFLIAGLVPMALAAGAPGAGAAGKIRVALGDIESVETLNLMIAFAQAKEQGVEVEMTAFKSEDIASQAVVSGQADIGIGTPYALIQNVGAPIRLFFQLATLQFYPVVNTEFYKSWKELDGQNIVVHSRTSGTLALANLMALKQGIKYANITYVPGSEVRALAMLNGDIKMTYLDSVNKNFLLKKEPNKFAVLPRGDASASDEALYASQAFLDSEAEAVDILLTALIDVWRKGAKNPQYIIDERKRLGLLPDLPADLEAEVLPFFEQAAETGMHPANGGIGAAAGDLEFYAVAGQLKGEPASLKAEDFWDLRPLNRVLDKVGRM